MAEEASIDLPPILAEVARIAGLRAALMMAADLGGSQVYIPKRPKDGSLLVGAVGIEAAYKLANEFGGQNVEVPLGPVANHRRQRKQIRKLLANCVPVLEIARRLGCHSRTVRRVKNRRATSGHPRLPF